MRRTQAVVSWFRFLTRARNRALRLRAVAALLPLFAACHEPAVQRDKVEHAPSRSLAHPPAPRAAAPVRAQEQTLLASAAKVTPLNPVSTPIDELEGTAIADVVTRALRKGELPGCVIAIGTSETLLYMRAFGERTHGEPMTLDTRFDL